MSTLNIVIAGHYYSKDPQSSDLGRQIVTGSIKLMDGLGYEEFTFKKLAEEIGSTEASIYRYFENKHKLLVYITTWYWAWMEYVIDYKTHFINDSREKLSGILKILCHLDIESTTTSIPDMDINALKRIVANESDKTYLTKHVDEINNQGLFKGFKGLCHVIAQVIQDLAPNYAYPHSMASTIIEASHHQAFFALHLPSLTEIRKDDTTPIDRQVYAFLTDTISRLF